MQPISNGTRDAGVLGQPVALLSFISCLLISASPLDIHFSWRKSWNHIHQFNPQHIFVAIASHDLNFHRPIIFFLCSLIWGERQLFFLLLLVEMLTIAVSTFFPGQMFYRDLLFSLFSFFREFKVNKYINMLFIITFISYIFYILIDLIWFFWCLTPLSAIFQLYHGDQF